MGVPEAYSGALDKVMNNETQSVDVIIPVFNGSKTIEACINSVLAQKGNILQKIIIIDDGSSDDSAQIITNYNNPIIKIIKSKNQGVSSARNLGFEQTTAKWIAFLDADDLWLPDKLIKQLNIAKKFEVNFVCCGVNAQLQLKSGFISAETLAYGNFIATSSVLVRRDLMQKIKPVFNSKMSFAEDYLAWLKCLTIEPGYYLSEKYAEYTLSDQPRYQLKQIFTNLLIVNIEYIKFLNTIKFPLGKKILLVLSVAFGTIMAIPSILKRFISSRKYE